MSFTKLFFPAMLLLLALAAALLIEGLRRQSRWKTGASLGLFILAGTCMGILMEFITRM